MPSTSLRNQSWDSYVLDFLGTARRVCIAVKEFRSRFDRWPDRLRIDSETLESVREQLTPAGFDRLINLMSVELQDHHTLAVADSQQNLFDYNEPSGETKNTPTSMEEVTVWLWGVRPPAKFE